MDIYEILKFQKMLLRKKRFKKKNYILVNLILLLCISCNIRSVNDIYEKIPLGSKLTKEILTNANQIIPNKSDVILVYDISTKWDVFSPHLLFYDSTLTLYASSFFSSDKVDSIKNNIINAILYDDRQKRKASFRNELPKQYKLNLYPSTTNGRGINKSNMIIDKMELQTNGNDVKLQIRRSENLFVGVGYRRSTAGDSTFFQNFPIADTIKYPIVELLYDFNKDIVIRKFVDDKKYLIREEMILVNKDVLIDFFDQLLLR